MTNDLFNTIEGFELLTRQQAFDLSASHILKTKQKSITISEVPLGVEPVESCVYGGSGCAASVFLKDDNTRVKCDELALQMGGSSWYVLYGNGIVPITNYSLICELQQAHDSAKTGDEFLDSWKKKMVDIAKRHQLDNSILDQANG